MSTAQARKIVKFIRKQTDLSDIEDILVDRYEIGYDEASLLLMLSKTNFG